VHVDGLRSDEDDRAAVNTESAKGIEQTLRAVTYAGSYSPASSFSFIQRIICSA